jgi:hypothetical protein
MRRQKQSERILDRKNMNKEYNLEIWRELNLKRNKLVGKLNRKEWEQLPFYTDNYHVYPLINGSNGSKCLAVEKEVDYQQAKLLYVNTDLKKISFWSCGRLIDYKLEPIKERCSPDGMGGEKGWFWSDRVFRVKVHPNHLVRVIDEINKK